MKRYYFGISVLIASILLMAFYLVGAGQVLARQSDVVEKSVYSFAPNELLVKTKKGIKSYSVNAVKDAYVLHEHAKSSVSTVKLPPGSDLQAAIRKYKADPNVEYVEPNYLRKSFFTPNDPNLNMEWHLDKIRAKEAWDITKGNSQVAVAVIDTGVDYNHPDLQDKLVTPYNSITSASSAADVVDDAGHGTIVSGIVAGAMDNGIGIAGVGGNISVMPVKAGDATGFYDWDIANGIYWAVDNGARVINLSLGGEYFSYTLESAVNYAVSHDVVVIASAGNQNSNVLMYPAAFPGVVGVAATTQTDEPADFSNYGSYIDVSAPGVNIYSTTPSGGTVDYDPSYDSASGTSMAAPIVAGLAGLVLSVNPSLTSEELINVIINGSDDLGQQGWDETTGWGRVNAFKTLSLLTDVVPPTVISVDPANYSKDVPVSKTITVNFSEHISAGESFSGIILRDGGNNTVPIVSSITRNTLEIKPVNLLSYSTGYFLTIPNGAVQDQVYNGLQFFYTTGFSTQDAALNTLPEPNETMETATVITANQSYSGTFAEAGDKDFYKLSVTGTGPVYFSTAPTSNALKDALVTIKDPSGDVAARATFSGNSTGVQVLQVSGGAGDYYILFESADGSPWGVGEEYSFNVNMQQELRGRLRDTQGLTADYSTGDYKAVITPIDVPGYAGPNPILINPGADGTFTAGVLPAGIYRVNAQHPGKYIDMDKIVYANGWEVGSIIIDLWPGDITGDDIINSSDIDEWGYALWTTPSSLAWNAMADINKDGIVDMRDLVHIAVNFSRQKTEVVHVSEGVSGGGGIGGGPTNIYAQPSKSQVMAGEVFTVEFKISNNTASQGIVAADIFLTYDPSKFELQDSLLDQGVQVANGSIIDQYTNRLIWNKSIQGQINYGGTRLASGGKQFTGVVPFRGTETLFTATFKALNEGTAAFGVDTGSSIILDRLGQLIEYSTAAVSVKVFTPIVNSTVAVLTDGSNNDLAVTEATPSASIVIPREIADATISMATMLNPAVAGTITSKALPALNITANTSINANPVLLAVPSGATVSVPESASWDGTIHLPTVKPVNTVTVTPDSGMTAAVNTVIEVGFDDVPLTLSKAVRILIPGQAGKDAGYYRNGTFTKITTIMTADSQAAGDLLPSGGDGKINAGSDLVIWTKHFTKFVTFTQTVISSGGSSSGGDTSGGSSSGGSSSGGSSSGGSSSGGGAAPVAVPSIAPVTNVSQKITAGGGKIVTPSATVVVPKGALAGETTVTVFGIDQSWVSTPNPAGYSYASEIIEFGPDGKVFAKPVTITIKYDSTRIGLNDIFPYYLNEGKKVWERINGARIDRLNGNISFETKHFSIYTVMTPDKPNTDFSDTKKHWAQNLITEYVARGAISGVAPGKFGPDNKITRAEFCKLLVVAMDFRINDSVNPFNDISEKDWFYPWVATAANLGIVHGYNFQFRPYAYITREEMAVMILKALDAKGKFIERDSSVLNKFRDRGKVSKWAQDSVSQAVKSKIINGRSSTVLAPLDNATKAEAIAMAKKVEILLK